jgi:hypothetical protein
MPGEVELGAFSDLVGELVVSVLQRFTNPHKAGENAAKDGPIGHCVLLLVVLGVLLRDGWGLQEHARFETTPSQLEAAATCG